MHQFNLVIPIDRRSIFSMMSETEKFEYEDRTPLYCDKVIVASTTFYGSTETKKLSRTVVETSLKSLKTPKQCSGVTRNVLIDVCEKGSSYLKSIL